MTTHVKILNEGPGNIEIREMYNQEDIPEPVVVLPPGATTINYIWFKGRNLLISEQMHPVPERVEAGT